MVRISMLCLGLVTVVACNGNGAATAPPAQPTRTPTAAAPTATPTTAIAVPGAPPLFTYVEGTDELTFWPPTTLRLVRAGAPPKTCMSELSTGNDNMWTGPDVERAFANADVQLAITQGTAQSFLPEVGDGGVITEGVLKTTKASLEWKLTPCHWCIAPPAGITRLHHVLAGVMMNRRLLCP